jgi:hypothetical protein
MKTVRRLIVRAIWMFNASTMLLSTGLLFALASVGLISGCVAGGTREAIGVEYPIEQVASVRPGMPEEEVIKLLGKPYARGEDLDGNTFLQYEYLVTTETAVAGGVLVIGKVGSESLSGGKSRIILDPSTRTVKTVHYEIYGAEWYDKLRGERHEKNP